MWAHHAEAVQEYQEQERREKADVASVHAAKLGKKKQNPRYPPAQPPNVHCLKNVAVRFQIPSVVARILWIGPNTHDATFSWHMRTIQSSPSVPIRNLGVPTLILCIVDSQFNSAGKPRLNSQTTGQKTARGGETQRHRGHGGVRRTVGKDLSG